MGTRQTLNDFTIDLCDALGLLTQVGGGFYFQTVLNTLGIGKKQAEDLLKRYGCKLERTVSPKVLFILAIHSTKPRVIRFVNTFARTALETQFGITKDDGMALRGLCETMLELVSSYAPDLVNNMDKYKTGGAALNNEAIDYADYTM